MDSTPSYKYKTLKDCLNSSKKVVTLDGGLGTELEARGLSVDSPLWSSTILMTQPQSIQALHYDYYKSGASIAITSSYQGAEDSLRQFGSQYNDTDERNKFYHSCVKVANDAKLQIIKDRSKDLLVPPLVSGSIGPYGASLCDGSEFSGNYKESINFYKKFHCERLKSLAEDENVNLLSIETIPEFGEIKALVELAQELKIPFLLTMSIKDPYHLADGTAISEVTDYLIKEKVFEKGYLLAIGANCLKLRFSIPFLDNLNSLTPKNFPLIIYPNSGEIYDGITKEWHQDPELEDGDFSWPTMVTGWIKNGARIVGGCCRVGVKDIEEIHNVVENYNRTH